jgi:hypothetical protein
MTAADNRPPCTVKGCRDHSCHHPRPDRMPEPPEVVVWTITATAAGCRSVTWTEPAPMAAAAVIQIAEKMTAGIPTRPAIGEIQP